MTIKITQNAWNRISKICEINKSQAFLFTAKRYKNEELTYIFRPCNDIEYYSFMNNKLSMILGLSQDNIKLKVIIDPFMDKYLYGIKIDYHWKFKFDKK